MGVYIKDMTLDEFYEYGDDCQTLIGIGQADEVPPHGRLIDADALIELLKECGGYALDDSGMPPSLVVVGIINDIKKAPTIIESEEKDG